MIRSQLNRVRLTKKNYGKIVYMGKGEKLEGGNSKSCVFTKSH